MGAEEKRLEVEKRRRQRLEWRDYVALIIASLQTVLLPFVILIVVMIMFGIFIHALVLG